MSEVKRYDLRQNMTPVMTAFLPDCVVSADDYDALQSRLDAAARNVKHWQDLAVANRKVADEALAEIAASDQALRESRANDLTTMATLADVRAELSALKAQQVGQEPAGEVHLRKGGGISLLHVELAQPLPPGTKLYTAPQPAPSQDVAGLASSDPVAKAEFETRLRKEFESRWPKPKGVTWGAGINDYCVSEFAEGIALSYPDMWMAYKAGAMRTNQ